jgi:hypothetical protein
VRSEYVQAENASNQRALKSRRGSGYRRRRSGRRAQGLIDYLESQHSDYDRLISDLDDDVRDLRRVVSNDVKALKRRVRELEGQALTL